MATGFLSALTCSLFGHLWTAWQTTIYNISGNPDYEERHCRRCEAFQGREIL